MFTFKRVKADETWQQTHSRKLSFASCQRSRRRVGGREEEGVGGWEGGVGGGIITAYVKSQ